MSKGGIAEFLVALFASEGGGVVDIENKFGYIGKYQFGESALTDLGYYKGDSSSNHTALGKFKYDWIGEWTGKNGATSKDVFLKSETIQDIAAHDWIKLLCKQMKHYDLAKYIGDTMAGFEITESGIIAAAHLKGFGNAAHPGVNQFLRSGGTNDGNDANGTKVSDYMKKFADYDLGCCAHLVVNLLDREKAPISGLDCEIRAGKECLKKGKTDSNGAAPRLAIHPSHSTYDVFVARIEGGMKKIASFAAPATSALVTLFSPKVEVETALEQHHGNPGPYRAGKHGKSGKHKGAHHAAGHHKTAHHKEHHHKAPHPGEGHAKVDPHKAAAPHADPKAAHGKTDAAKPSAGASSGQEKKAATTPERGAKGNPVAVVQPEKSTGKLLSGAAWVSHFPGSKSLDDLKPDFQPKAKRFIEALKAAGVHVRISATFRPEERAYLMHYCCKVADGTVSPDKVPPKAGVEIEWAHRDADGKLNVQASRAAALAMMEAYDIQYPAALISEHTKRNAIDMTITGFENKTVKDGSGNDTELSTKKDLFKLGATYGVLKLEVDKPHWSGNGS
jgi:hypothetical protein